MTPPTTLGWVSAGSPLLRASKRILLHRTASRAFSNDPSGGGSHPGGYWHAKPRSATPHRGFGNSWREGTGGGDFPWAGKKGWVSRPQNKSGLTTLALFLNPIADPSPDPSPDPNPNSSPPRFYSKPNGGSVGFRRRHMVNVVDTLSERIAHAIHTSAPAAVQWACGKDASVFDNITNYVRYRRFKAEKLSSKSGLIFLDMITHLPIQKNNKSQDNIANSPPGFTELNQKSSTTFTSIFSSKYFLFQHFLPLTARNKIIYNCIH